MHEFSDHPFMAVRRFTLVASTAICLLVAPAHAVQPDEIMPDPAQEARARSLSEGLRCLVCQNQSIDDSAAPLARDLRLIVRERIKAGDSDPAIRQFLVSRYGAFVLLKPPFEWSTLLLWLTPLIVLLGGAGTVVIRRMRHTPAAPASALSADEETRLAALTRDLPSA